jgi:hypothetical protein
VKFLIAIRTPAIHDLMDPFGVGSAAHSAVTLIPGVILIANPTADGTGAAIPIVIAVPSLTTLLTRAAIPGMFCMINHPAMRALAAHHGMTCGTPLPA